MAEHSDASDVNTAAVSKDTTRVPTSEMLDVNCVLRKPSVSTFLNRFFSADGKINEADDDDRPSHTVVDTNLSKEPNGPLVVKPKPKKSSRKMQVYYQPYTSDFKIESHKDRLCITNVRPIRIFERSRTIIIGVKIAIPSGFFGLTNCFHPPGCICVTDILNSGETDVRAHIANTTLTPLEILPMTLQMFIHIVPKIFPEPWQTVNLPAPHSEAAYFDLRTHRHIHLPPNSTAYLTFNTTHLCGAKTHSVLIIPCRHLAFKKILLDPTIWRPGMPPIIRTNNISSATQYISAGTLLAKVIFTSAGITQFSPALTSIITSLHIPKSQVHFTKPGPRHNKVNDE
ncbi:B72 [Murid betaherpesvirus 8]|uniref:B72 n=2 Tax=Rat cytomegalovirus (isolate England) TaxID=1261657 RepID=K7XR09_RCMVE|nr:E72 [Murid betaherpesvirus 8]AKE44239.1 a72 [Rat cytomegalovirus ALL-03]AFX83386.1 E72 [Murid betaherpesvirus 8]AKB93266.1 B72 [Murid betaherpesvirus 8]WEG71858.1 deoxyuridine triphosphatase [Murid betaherpesvirus 8]WPH24981.1 B72 [Murid betaherpesvirus 8]